MSVVGVDATDRPRIVREHDVGSRPPDDAAHLRARPEIVVELSVDVTEVRSWSA